MSMTAERGWWKRREPNPRPDGTGIEVNLDGPDGAAAGREAASVSGLVPEGAGRPGLAVRRALEELEAPRSFIPSNPEGSVRSGAGPAVRSLDDRRQHQGDVAVGRLGPAAPPERSAPLANLVHAEEPPRRSSSLPIDDEHRQDLVAL